MEIKNSEWTDFAEFIARQSIHPVSNYIEDGEYVCCPFSTMERAYAAFSIWRTCHSQSEVKKFYDVNFGEKNPDYDYMEEYCRDMEKEINENAALIKQNEIEECYEQQYPEYEWPDEADTYIKDREKQITRIAHELANKYGKLPLFGKKSWASLVYPFYKMYELNSDEKYLFVSEYYTQLYLNCDFV